MKRSLQHAVALIMLGSLPAAAHAQVGAGRVGYVKVQDVVAQMPGYAAKADSVNREIQGYQAELERMAGAYDSAAAKFSQGSALMSQGARDAEQTRLRDQAAAINSHKNELQQRAMKRQDEVLGPLNNKITEAIEAVRASLGYSMILDVTSGAGVVVAADKSVDITQRVIDRLKGTSASGTTTPPASGGAPRKP